MQLHPSPQRSQNFQARTVAWVLGLFAFVLLLFIPFFFNASILQASWNPTTIQESDVYTQKTGGGEAGLSQP